MRGVLVGAEDEGLEGRDIHLSTHRANLEGAKRRGSGEGSDKGARVEGSINEKALTLVLLEQLLVGLGLIPRALLSERDVRQAQQCEGEGRTVMKPV